MSVAVSVLCWACRGVSARGARGRNQGGHRPVTTPGTQLNATCAEAETHYNDVSYCSQDWALETQPLLLPNEIFQCAQTAKSWEGTMGVTPVRGTLYN